MHYLCSLSHALPEVSGGTTATTARLFHLELKREGVYPRAGGVYPRAGVHPLLATQFCLRFYTFYHGKDKYLIFWGVFLWGDFFEDFCWIFVLDIFFGDVFGDFFGPGDNQGGNQGDNQRQPGPRKHGPGDNQGDNQGDNNQRTTRGGGGGRKERDGTL